MYLEYIITRVTFPRVQTGCEYEMALLCECHRGHELTSSHCTVIPGSGKIRSELIHKCICILLAMAAAC